VRVAGAGQEVMSMEEQTSKVDFNNEQYTTSSRDNRRRMTTP